MAHEGRVFQGVNVLGVNLGGMSGAEARAALSNAAKDYPFGSIAVSGAGRSWTFSAADLGVAVDEQQTLDAALNTGRGSDILSNLGVQAEGLFGGYNLAPILKHDPALVDRAIARIAADVDKPSLNSKIEQHPDGKAHITASSQGTILDRDLARVALVASLDKVPFAHIQITLRDDKPRVTEGDLQAAAAQIEQLTSLPIALKGEDATWTIEPSDLRNMVDLSSVSLANGQREIALNDSELTLYLNEVAAEAKIDPQDAQIVFGKNAVTLEPEQNGSELDMHETINAVKRAFSLTDAEARTVKLPMKVVTPTVHFSDLAQVYAKANTLVTEGVRMRFRDDGYILRGGSVTGFLSVTTTQGGPAYRLAIDEDVLAERIAGLGYYLNRNPADARFRIVGGAPAKTAAAQEGFKVNVEKSLPVALQAIESYTGTERLQVDLSVDVTAPAVKDADLASINTPDLLGTGQTSYAGSSAERAWNVGLGTRRVDGALIPPGGVFSTADTIGDLTLAAGFKMGYAIVNTGRGLTTVPAEAGGICQVATTLFHSVFWSGLPVVERNWHSYWIATYGRAPGGLQGLDATIAPPEKDFRFKNTTGNWILVKATADGQKVVFQLYGVNQGWSVKVSGPVITNPVKTSSEPVTEYSSQLPAGKKVLVEHAQDGFSANITRTVTDANGSVIDKWTARSRYAPARNRYLIGTGK